MSANIFKQYSIEEISKRTKISPISLKYIKDKEYDKIPRVKFLGFINILQREFGVDLSELIEEYNASHPSEKPIPTSNPTPPPPQEEEKKDLKKIIIPAIIGIGVFVGGYFLFNFSKQKPQKEEVKVTEIIKQTNSTKKMPTITPQESKIVAKLDENITEENITTPKNNQTIANKEINETNITKKPTLATYPVTIIPKQKVWFRAINLDTNKTISILTSNPKTLPKGNYYIKFGHGLVEMNYANKTISPNTKQIVRIILKNGEYEYIKKPPRGYPR